MLRNVPDIRTASMDAIGWCSDHLLNVFALATLRALRPLDAKALVARVACWYPVLTTADTAGRAASRLGVRGTCLSRALAVAARCSQADVVIAVTPASCPRSDYRSRTRNAIHAHAWVEVAGVAIPRQLQEDRWTELMRLRFEHRSSAGTLGPRSLVQALLRKRVGGHAAVS